MRPGDQVTYVGHEEDGVKGAIGVIDGMRAPGLWNVKLLSTGRIVICKTTELELANPEPCICGHGLAEHMGDANAYNAYCRARGCDCYRFKVA